MNNTDNFPADVQLGNWESDSNLDVRYRYRALRSDPTMRILEVWPMGSDILWQCRAGEKAYERDVVKGIRVEEVPQLYCGCDLGTFCPHPWTREKVIARQGALPEAMAMAEQSYVRWINSGRPVGSKPYMRPRPRKSGQEATVSEDSASVLEVITSAWGPDFEVCSRDRRADEFSEHVKCWVQRLPTSPMSALNAARILVEVETTEAGSVVALEVNAETAHGNLNLRIKERGPFETAWPKVLNTPFQATTLREILGIPHV